MKPTKSESYEEQRQPKHPYAPITVEIRGAEIDHVQADVFNIAKSNWGASEPTVTLMMADCENGTGLFTALTPDLARSAARALIFLADQLDAETAKKVH